MAKITFIGAGSVVFAKNILGDAMLLESMHDAEIALYDINSERLYDAQRMVSIINDNCNGGRARITQHLGLAELEDALRGADFVANALQVGGYDPCTIADFEIPKKYGLRQTIADTLGIGGIFRSLRTIPVMLHITELMERVCPRAILLNYTNPMCAITGAIQRSSSIHSVGLCHSVQGCVKELLEKVGLDKTYPIADVRWEIAGINHQAWLLSVTLDGKDLYPEIKASARRLSAAVRARGGRQWVNQMWEKLGLGADQPCFSIIAAAEKAHQAGTVDAEELAHLKAASDLVRFEVMQRFGHYITESSEHNAEYTPWFIKRGRDDLINDFNIPLDEYLRRSRRNVTTWKGMRQKLVEDTSMTHAPSCEFGSYIMDAVLTDTPIRIAGNVLNRGLIDNLPANACVEVPCLVDRNGIQPTAVGSLPEQCAALNRTNINPQLMTVDAALNLRKDSIYQAALLDPHTAAELSIDEIVSMCDELLEAHKQWLPVYK